MSKQQIYDLQTYSLFATVLRRIQNKKMSVKRNKKTVCLLFKGRGACLKTHISVIQTTVLWRNTRICLSKTALPGFMAVTGLTTGKYVLCTCHIGPSNTSPGFISARKKEMRSRTKCLLMQTLKVIIFNVTVCRMSNNYMKLQSMQDTDTCVVLHPVCRKHFAVRNYEDTQNKH